jgi:hypothetical protein
VFEILDREVGAVEFVVQLSDQFVRGAAKGAEMFLSANFYNREG